MVAALCDARRKREKGSRRDGEERGAAFRRLVVDELYSFSYVVGKNLLSPIIKERGKVAFYGPVPFVWYKTSLNRANRVVVPFFFRPKRDALRVERVRVDFGLSVVAYFAETHVHLNSYLKCVRNQKQQREDKAQSESRDSKEGSMSPIDLSKFTDEEYIAPEQHQNREQQHNCIYEHQQHGEQQASDDAMDWLDQATNTTRYFADPLDTFMQNFQHPNAGGGGSSEGADYVGVQTHETHFSLDSRMFENDSQPGISGAHVNGPKATVTSKKKPNSSSSKSKSSNSKSSNNNNKTSNNTNTNSSVQRSTSFTKARKTSSFKKSNLGGKKSSSQVDLTNAFTDLEQGMMHLNSNQVQPGAMRRIPSEIRMQQLARYREKRARRRSGHKKIRYECRKTLADNRPRFKGRFAKVIPNVASEGNLSTMSAPEPGEGAAAMNDVLDSIEAKSKGTGDADDTNKTEQQTKKETVMKNANEKAAAATTRRTRTETAAAAAAAKKKTRANSNSKGSEETNDSETAESDLISIEVAKRTRAVRRLQSNAKGLQVSQSEVSLVKLVES